MRWWGGSAEYSTSEVFEVFCRHVGAGNEEESDNGGEEDTKG